MKLARKRSLKGDCCRSFSSKSINILWGGTNAGQNWKSTAKMISRWAQLNKTPNKLRRS